jgi:hypothetical protein
MNFTSNILNLGNPLCGRNVMRGEERLMSATGKPELWNVTWKPEKGHLHPEIRVANVMTCDYVWDKLNPPISITCSKRYVRKVPFVLRAQPFNMSLLSCCWLA